MEQRPVMLVMVATLGALGVAWASEGVAGALGAVENTTETVPRMDSQDVLGKMKFLHCSKKYSLTCLKLDAVKLVDKLGHTPAYRLFPGISLVHSNYTQVDTLPPTVVAPLAQGNVTALDVFLMSRVTEYLNSLTLAVKILDSGTVDNARRLSEEILGSRHVSGQQTEGRKKGGGGAAMIAAGTMAAVGMAALAAVAGKAMMTSMLALMLAAAGAMRGGGNGGGGEKCGYPAARRSMVIQEHPVYRPSYTATYGPASP